MLSRRKWAITLGVIGVVTVLASLTAAGAGAQQKSAFALPRNATLYTSGSQWGPFNNFNPLKNGGQVVGLVGGLYETLFRYDPLKDKFLPWLATDGKWVGTTYVLHVRPGITWNDGKPFTAADVKFTYGTGKLAGSQYSTMWQTGLTQIVTKGSTVSFVFKGKPNYLDFASNLYQIPIVPQHVWKSYSATDITTGNADTDFVGTGPFMYESGKGTEGTLVWTRRSATKSPWWATKAFGMKLPMQYLADINNGSNAASQASFLNGDFDLSNNYFPPGLLAKNPQVGTYYKGEPYSLSANTAWLIPNTTRTPMNDKNFRRALAMSINIDQIRKDDFENGVQKANQTGLLPTFKQWIDQPQVDKLGFKYNPAGAKALLASSGYKTGSDGYVVNKDGSKIDLEIAVPNGWSDWMLAIQIITANTKATGIHLHTAFPDQATVDSNRISGKFDLVLNNETQLGPTPFTFYDYLFRLPIADRQVSKNYQRFNQAGAKPWALTVYLNKVSPANVKLAKSYHSKIQKFILEDIPAIPMWYNGMWAAFNTSHWTNFPSSTGKGRQSTPTVWNGYLNMTGIDMLANLKPVK
jgi:peptide/nickel transport system substrate-binding protein